MAKTETIEIVEDILTNVAVNRLSTIEETDEGLTNFLIESLKGEKVNGLLEGEGFIKFIDGHTYQGEFSNGLMHGQGCYIWSDGVTYDGDFYHNRICGKGMYTYPDGSTYEGEVYDGKRHGFGVYTLKNNAMSYSGQWYMGCKQGKGLMKYDSEGYSFYEGDWLNDVFHGWGKRRYPSGNEYQGMWSNNKQSVDGTMQWSVPGWSKCSECYNGQWSEGKHHGFGEHIWLTFRQPGTQFQTRNSYIGNFVNGMKHGRGIFQYADGAKYDGLWYKDMKHGQAKFTKTSGEIFTGTFVENHLPANNVIPGLPSFFSGEPCPSSNTKHNVTEEDFQIDIDILLRNYPELNRQQELEAITFIIWKHNTSLRNIYRFYSRIGCEISADNVYQMSNLQYWRFLKDCKLHHLGYSLTDMSRFIEDATKKTQQFNPFRKLLLRDLFTNLIILSFHLYHKQYIVEKEKSKTTCCMLKWCFSHLFRTNISPNAFKVKGYFFYESRKAVDVSEHIDKVYLIYDSLREQDKSFSGQSFRLRDFLFFLKDMDLINENLTIAAIVKILGKDDPNVFADGCYNLELEMTFLEFIEALVGCAEVYVTESMVESVSCSRQDTACNSEIINEHSQLVGSGSCSSINQFVLNDIASTMPVVIPAESEAVTSDEVVVESTSPKTSVCQSVRSTSSTPSSGSPDTSTIDNGLLCRVSDTKIMDLTNPLLTDVELPKIDGDNGDVSTIEECEETVSDGSDVKTKKYNFWTHQLHIFFLQNFIGPAQEFLEFRRIARTKVIAAIRQAKKMERIDAFHASHPVISDSLSHVAITANESRVLDEELSEPTQ